MYCWGGVVDGHVRVVVGVGSKWRLRRWVVVLLVDVVGGRLVDLMPWNEFFGLGWTDVAAASFDDGAAM